ncbi:MAG: hypothetical protein ACJ8EB_03450 [Allosphingosinicella sp.]
MPIKKDAASGWHFISYLVPVRDKKRMRYQPGPLATPSRSIFGFFADFFRRGPNPFLASPVAFNIDRRVKLERNARMLARRGGEGGAGQLVSQIEGQLRSYLHRGHGRADDVLDALDLETNEEETQLEECRPNAIKEEFKGKVEDVVADVDSHLGPLARHFHEIRREHDKFIEDYGLESKKGVHAGHPIDAKFLLSLIGVTAFEFILNTAFFSGSQKNGLIGGAALAMILSISTIFLGICFGWSYQFSDPRADGNGWRGRIGFLMSSLATIFYLLLLTLARRAGDAGDLDMFGTAAREIQAHPFSGILDLPALGYCFFSIGVITLVSSKFVDTMGHFPRIRGHKLAVENAELAFEDVRRGMAAELEHRIAAAIAKLDDVPSILQARKLALKEILVDYENVISQLNADVRELRDAEHIMVGVVRSHLGGDKSQYAIDVDYKEELDYFADRLATFTRRIESLLQRAQVSQSVIDKSRTEMGNLGKRKRKELEHACQGLRHLKAPARAPRTDPPAPEGGNVSWLRPRRT